MGCPGCPYKEVRVFWGFRGSLRGSFQGTLRVL